MSTPARLTIGVLLCDTVDPSRLAIAGDYPEIFRSLFRTFTPPEFEITLRFYDVTAHEYPARLDECDGYLTNGAGASVNDPAPWIANLAAFMRRLHQHHVRLVAICFGHQMIARALGGRVEASERGWGVGVHEITVTSPEVWMIPPAHSLHLLSSHQDQVTALPPGAIILASSPHCPVSMLRCGSLLGIQGHPEFTTAYARALLDSRRDILPLETLTRAEQSFAQPPDTALLVSWIVHYLASPID